MQRGAHLNVSDTVSRISPVSVDPTAKNYHWGDFTQGLFEAKEAGFDNTMLLDDNGNVTEGPGFNVFMVKDGKARTPRSGVLEGITRKVAIEICAHHDVAVSQDDIPLAEFLEADEVFATTTGGGPVPITRINDRVFSNNAPGAITRKISDTYWQWHTDPTMSEAVDGDY